MIGGMDMCYWLVICPVDIEIVTHVPSLGLRNGRCPSKLAFTRHVSYNFYVHRAYH